MDPVLLLDLTKLFVLWKFQHQQVLEIVKSCSIFEDPLKKLANIKKYFVVTSMDKNYVTCQLQIFAK